MRCHRKPKRAGFAIPVDQADQAANITAFSGEGGNISGSREGGVGNTGAGLRVMKILASHRAAWQIAGRIQCKRSAGCELSCSV